MGILKGKPAKSTSASGSAQTWAQPFASQAAQDTLNVFNSAQPQLQAAQGNVNSLIGNLNSTASGLSKQVGGDMGTAGAGNSYYRNLIGGSQLSGNPYVRNVLGQLDQSVMDGVNSNFESAGRYGSGAYVGELAKQLGAANSNVLYQNYNDAANRQLQAAQAADQALQGQQAAQAQNAQQQLAASQLQGQMPYYGIQAMGNSLGALFNGGNSTSTGGTPGLLGAIGAVGAGLASNPLLFK